MTITKKIPWIISPMNQLSAIWQKPLSNTPVLWVFFTPTVCIFHTTNRKDLPLSNRVKPNAPIGRKPLLTATTMPFIICPTWKPVC